MSDVSNIGKLGEDIAAKTLMDRRFKIIGRNVRRPWGEVDIIAISPDKTLVFFEVKTLVSGNLESLTPEDNMTNAKIERLKKICEYFAIDNQDLISEEKGWRIDLISIGLSSRGGLEAPHNLTDIMEYCTIKVYENV